MIAFSKVARIAFLGGQFALAAIWVQPAVYAAQEQPAKAPLDQVLGTVSAIDAANHSFTVKEDKTNTEYTVATANTRRFLKISPGEKDLRKAQPVEFSSLATGDRLLARGHKEDANKLDASIVIVMTAGELQQKHQSEIADWQQRGIKGVVQSVDPTGPSLTMTERSAGTAKTLTVTMTPQTLFTRYSPQSIKFDDAKPSTFSQVGVGDQLWVLGNKNADETQVAAEKILSGSFKTLAVTLKSVSPDGKQLEVINQQTKQPVTLNLTEQSAVRKLPPQMAAGMAARMNGGTRPAGAAGGEAPSRPQPDAARPEGAPAGPRGPRSGGDLSQLLERVPTIPVSDLKPGDALIVNGGQIDPSHLAAINIIAGVEPLLSSPAAASGNGRGRSDALGSWNLDLGGVGEQ